MAVSIADIQKIRKMTGAGLADCKKALTETDGDFDKAVEIIREKGQAIAAKRSDRETSNGCVLAKADNGFAAIVALKCETDFVANGADYIKLTQDILDVAVAAKAKSLDEVKELALVDGTKVQDAVDEIKGSVDILDSTVVKLTGDQTIEDVKTFMSSPIVPTPTAVNQAVNKQYVDNMVISSNGYAVAMAIVFGS